jgi:pimeloyl-ACP methyl ester carboxylesterase
MLEKLKRIQYGARIKLYSGDQMNVAEVRGRRTQYLRGGAGTPLLYLHTGIGETSWLPFHQALSRQFDIIAPAHPGFALSANDAELERIDDLVFHYLDLLEHLHLDQVHIVGASVGGWIAAELALRYPERVNRLVLVAAAGLLPEASHTDPLFESLDAEDLRTVLFHDAESFAAGLLFPDIEEPGKMGVVARAVSPVTWSSDLCAPRLERHLQRISNPTLVIWGANDALYPAPCAQRFREGITNSSIYVIEKCGHLPMFEQETRFVTAVTRFLNASESAFAKPSS